MSNTKLFASQEFELLHRTWGIDHNPDEKPIIFEFEQEMLALIDKFGNSGQSGSSAPYVAAAICGSLKMLMLHQPIAPITGIKDEWSDVTEHPGREDTRTALFQNKRCGALFKDNIRCWYLDAIVWQGEDDFDSFTGTVQGITSRQCVKGFPFEPKTFRIDVRREKYDIENPTHSVEESVSAGDGDYIYIIKQPEQLNEVFEYYKKYEKAV